MKTVLLATDTQNLQSLPTNRFLFGDSIAGAEDAELYGGLDVVFDY